MRSKSLIADFFIYSIVLTPYSIILILLFFFLFSFFCVFALDLNFYFDILDGHATGCLHSSWSMRAYICCCSADNTRLTGPCQRCVSVAYGVQCATLLFHFIQPYFLHLIYPLRWNTYRLSYTLTHTYKYILTYVLVLAFVVDFMCPLYPVGACVWICQQFPVYRYYLVSILSAEIDLKLSWISGFIILFE